MFGRYPIDYSDYLQKATSWQLLEIEGITVTEEIDNSALLGALHEAAGKLSYFNAGEGDCYARERGSRAAAFDNFRTLRELAIERGIYDPKDFGNYLI